MPHRLHSRGSNDRGAMACHAAPPQQPGGGHQPQQPEEKNFFERFFDFSNGWAPKSTRIWRLQEYEYTEGTCS